MLGADDIASLTAAGIAEVTVARLGAHDLDEDAAAALIASALVPDPQAANLRLTGASTGRVNIYATLPGVLTLDVPAIEAANLVDPMITVATLPPFARTRTRGMVATVKIIAYGIDATRAQRAADLLKGAAWVHPVQLHSASLIQTDTGAGPGKGEDAIAGRLEALGITLKDPDRIGHVRSARCGARGPARCGGAGDTVRDAG